MDYAVVQTVRVGRKARHIVRGWVRGVPDKTKPQTVADALSVAGEAPSEAGIEWANHTVKPAARLAAAETNPFALEYEWAKLERPAPRQLNTRIPPRLYARCEDAARAAGLPLRAWVERVLTDATAALDDGKAQR